MIKYIDCDGVILDTETHLFDDYDRLKQENPDLRKRDYLANLDWDVLIYQAAVINDAINLLKEYDPRGVHILTRIHSLREAKAKINYFRSSGVKNGIIIVNSEFKKSEVVNAKGNILVDDSTANLDDWAKAGGIPIQFSSTLESGFPTVSTLECVLDDSILDHHEIRLMLNK